MSLPALIVFDLDFTLWDCGGTWCDCLAPPFCRRETRVLDRHDSWIRLYNDVPSILDWCDDQAIAMALASRTEQPTWATELLDLLQIRDRFPFAEIYPTSKLKHFDALREASGCAYSEMLFFDDELRNISEVSELGVTSIHVRDGLTNEVFHEGLEQYERQSA